MSSSTSSLFNNVLLLVVLFAVALCFELLHYPCQDLICHGDGLKDDRFYLLCDVFEPADHLAYIDQDEEKVVQGHDDHEHREDGEKREDVLSSE